MDVTFRPLTVDDDFDISISARKDAYFCSFGHLNGFDDFVRGYRERVGERLVSPEWFYILVLVDGTVAGQLEFRSFSSEPETGYVHLIYLQPEYRGVGIAPLVQSYIEQTLVGCDCKRAVLSVSRTNERAMAFYKQHGCEFVRKNPKHEETDFYQLKLRT